MELDHRDTMHATKVFPLVVEEGLASLLKTMLTRGEVEIKRGAEGYIAYLQWWSDGEGDASLETHSARGYSPSLSQALLLAWDGYCIETGFQIFPSARREKSESN